MVAFPSAAASVQQRVLRVIRQRKPQAHRPLRLTSDLEQDLHFDQVDTVDVILALEHRFQLTIPDEVPLRVVGDLVRYIAAQVSAPGAVGRATGRRAAGFGPRS